MAGPNRRRDLILPALLFVVGAIAIALVSELGSSPLERVLAGLPAWLTATVVLALLAVGLAATIAYERLSRPDRPPKARRPGGRALTRTTAAVAMVAAAAGGAVAGGTVAGARRR